MISHRKHLKGRGMRAYCKKLTRTLFGVLDVTVIGSTKTQIFGRTQSAEFTEIMIEVRLVGITVVERQTDPIDVHLLADGMNHLLKALHTAEEFWSHSYFVAKELNEAPLAETDT